MSVVVVFRTFNLILWFYVLFSGAVVYAALMRQTVVPFLMNEFVWRSCLVMSDYGVSVQNGGCMWLDSD